MEVEESGINKYKKGITLEMNDNNFNRENECFYNFDSFVDPSMLLPEDVGFDSLSANDFAVMDSIPDLPTEIPPVNAGSSKEGPGSLYEKLRTTPSVVPGSPTVMMSPIPGSPTLYPYGSPFSMGSPSSLMMSTGGSDTSWMHSNRPRRRRSNYTSPMMMMSSQPTPTSPYLNSFAPYLPPYGNPMIPAYPHAPFMMAPPMSPMNVTVKLPMAPLTPTNYSNGNNDGSSSALKIPLVLPCHLQQQDQQAQNTVAPNVSKLQTCLSSSTISSGVPSRCSSIAPNSSISSRSIASSQRQQNWFTEISATKDRFLRDVDGIDFTNVTVLELKQILRRFGLNSTGKKAQLVERIKEISKYLKTEGKKRVKLDKEQAETEIETGNGVISSLSASCASSVISAAV